ncbi:hypothetical protein LCI18_012173 [Fusarium solani-melongenae]|uniref:Uncharacterized protein n=1 Tax=Fusarium solani subsp. cucurbitae TaxID=2747967 RepID=A0ACD3ZMB8_FUSSC|nr:hypothetical protein LCI18_012173 [Fusarium solani-melongenae]
MWECYINDIYILYLPAHSSHLLQPLDLTVFSVMKKAYRREVQRLIEITDDSALGKAYFLKCYLKARMQAMKPETIRAGWKSSGMWPVSITKPLLNPWFIERQRRRESNAFQTPSAKRKLPIAIEEAILTPYRSLEVRTGIEFIANKEELGYTARLLFRKAAKGLDQHLATIADRDRRIHILEAQLEHFRPKKRKKVKLGPNERFANIEAIWKTREQVRKLGKEYADDVESGKISQKDLEGEFQLFLDHTPEN